MDMQKLEKRMNDMKITIPMMARELGMDQSTYYRKRQKNGEDFSVLDLLTFKRVLKMNGQEAQDILLS